VRHRSSENIVGVDFGAPRWARDQRRKIIAIEARPTDVRRYRIEATGLNERLLATDPLGWSAAELLDELLTRPVHVVGFDFPFSVPEALLWDQDFACDVGERFGPFRGWRRFSSFVAQTLKLTDPLDFGPFEAWRSRDDRARLWTKRATNVAARGQPPLKDKFQSVFQMTLLGNALLSRMWDSKRYRVMPFGGPSDENEAIEVYPAATLRCMGLTSYKSRPEEAIRLAIGACRAAGVMLDVDLRVIAFCCRYDSGGRTPDHDGADAFVALCTAILYRDGHVEWRSTATGCRFDPRELSGCPTSTSRPMRRLARCQRRFRDEAGGDEDVSGHMTSNEGRAA